MSEDKTPIESIRCMATDTLGDDSMDMPLSEFVKTLKAKPESEASKPLLVYHKEPEWEWLKRVRKTTVRPNPNAISELATELASQNQEALIDLYHEKEQRRQGETPTTDLEAIEALESSELINPYEERRLEALKKQGRR